MANNLLQNLLYIHFLVSLPQFFIGVSFDNGNGFAKAVKFGLAARDG